MRDLEFPGRSTVHAMNGMAATSHPLSTLAAVNVLQSGGNAMDAAIVASAVQCVVEPQSTGIGGDCFCLYQPAGGAVVAFNGSGRAPAAANVEYFVAQDIATFTPHSPHTVTIPGAVDGWAQLLADHGTLSLGDALAPAINLARDGYVIHHRVHFDWQLYENLLRRDGTAARIFLVNDAAPTIGSIHRQPELADTLEHIAIKGRDGFYNGRVAEDMVTYLRSLGGLHTLDDFASASGEYVTPIKTTYKGYDVYECPPNGQGIVALEMLNILSGMGLENLTPHSAARLHLEIEASRLAYRDRDAMLCDPAFADMPVEYWLSEEHARKNRGLIQPTRALNPLPPSDFPAHEDTVYISIVDKDRNAVSFINSIFSPFGSGLVSPQTGVLLHNRGRGFSLKPGHPNCIAPGKRPLHTIIPGLLAKNGRAVMPFGVMGGQYQACGHAHLLTNLLDYDMDLQEAIDGTRVFPTNAGTVEVERSLPKDVRTELESLGHALAQPERPIGGAQAVWIDWETGVLSGASDPRKDGMAIGY